MARYREDKKRWQARAKRNGREYHLGYWKTEREALEVEWIFNEDRPSRAREPKNNNPTGLNGLLRRVPHRIMLQRSWRTRT
jgi:hypothetical protein